MHPNSDPGHSWCVVARPLEIQDRSKEQKLVGTQFPKTFLDEEKGLYNKDVQRNGWTPTRIQVTVTLQLNLKDTRRIHSHTNLESFWEERKKGLKIISLTIFVNYIGKWWQHCQGLVNELRRILVLYFLNPRPNNTFPPMFTSVTNQKGLWSGKSLSWPWQWTQTCHPCLLLNPIAYSYKIRVFLWMWSFSF